jgi:hypothetical protein
MAVFQGSGSLRPAKRIARKLPAGFRRKLAFGELEAAAGSCLTVLFPFHHPGIAGKVPVAPEAGVISLIHLTKRPGQTMTAGIGLAIDSAAIDIYQDVKFVFVGSNHQGLAHHQGMLPLDKILGQFLAVYDDFAASIPNIHPGNGSLPSACTDTKILNHLTLPLKPSRNFRLWESCLDLLKKANRLHFGLAAFSRTLSLFQN